MARARRGAAAIPGGVRWPGIYAAMLQHERELHAHYGDLRVWADPDDHSAGCFCWPRDRLDALEAGEQVVVRRHELPHGMRERPASMRWDPHEWVSVHSDDTITPAKSPVVDPIRRPVSGWDWPDNPADD